MLSCVKKKAISQFAVKFVEKSNHSFSVYMMNYIAQLFHDGGRYHIETSPLICRANQWTGVYMITAPFTFN